MNAEVIKEYLVSLGFSVDEAGEKKFSSVLAGVAANAVKVGLAVENTALSVVAFTTKIASSLDELHWISQRTGASVQGIKSIGYSVAQMGGSADAARGSLESLARFVRNNPGAEGFLNRLGVQTRDAQGNMRDMAAIFTGVGQSLSSMPYYRANQYAQMLGIDENTLMAMRRGLGEFSAQYSAMTKAIGFNADQASVSANKFITSLRSFGEMASMARDKIGSNLADGLAGAIDTLRRRILDNFPQIENVITKTVNGIIWLGEVVSRLAFRAVDAIGDIIDWWGRLDAESKKLIAVLGGLLIAWRVLNAAMWSSPVAWVLALAGALLLLYDDYKTWKEGGDSLIDWSKWEPAITLAKDAIIWLRDKMLALKDDMGGWKSSLGILATFIAGAWITKILGAFSRLAGVPMPPWLKGWMAYAAYLYTDRDNISASANSSINYAKRGMGDVMRWLGIDTDYGLPEGTVKGANIQPDIPGGEGTLADRNNNPGNLRPVSGKGFRSFASAMDGWDAMKNQLTRYFTGKTTGTQLKTIRDIVATWAPAADNNDPEQYAKQVASWMGTTPDTVLNLADPNQMGALMQSMARKEGYSNWNSPQAYQAAGVQIQQHNTYNISGGNAQQVGSEVAQRQQSSNAQLLRASQVKVG